MTSCTTRWSAPASPQNAIGFTTTRSWSRGRAESSWCRWRCAPSRRRPRTRRRRTRTIPTSSSSTSTSTTGTSRTTAPRASARANPSRRSAPSTATSSPRRGRREGDGTRLSPGRSTQSTGGAWRRWRPARTDGPFPPRTSSKGTRRATSSRSSWLTRWASGAEREKSLAPRLPPRTRTAPSTATPFPVSRSRTPHRSSPSPGRSPSRATTASSTTRWG